MPMDATTKSRELRPAWVHASSACMGGVSAAPASRESLARRPFDALGLCTTVGGATTSRPPWPHSSRARGVPHRLGRWPHPLQMPGFAPHARAQTLMVVPSRSPRHSPALDGTPSQRPQDSVEVHLCSVLRPRLVAGVPAIVAARKCWLTPSALHRPAHPPAFDSLLGRAQ